MKFETIRFEGLSFAFEDGEQVFRNLDFDFPTDKIFWVKGEEGSGKSSLLQILAGLQVPQSGKYLINGEDVVDMSFEEFLPYRLKIGYSFDYGGLLSNRSLLSNLTLPLLYHKISTNDEATERAEELLQTFDILKYAKERPAHVPGRVRKIAVLARALITQPQLLLLDDPSVGLGIDAMHSFADYINKNRKDGVFQHIFISSFDDKFMSLFDHRLIHVDDGNLYLQEVDFEKKVANL